MKTSSRPAAVAGFFYPAEPQLLRGLLDRQLEDAEEPSAQTRQRPKMLLVPHAGYIYSGEVAATAFATLRPWREQIERVVLLGPAHRLPVRGMALPAVTSFETPLGRIPLDLDAMSLLKDLPQVESAEPPHAQEHSLEVQLPFLQRVLGDGFKLLPVLVGGAGPLNGALAVAARHGLQPRLLCQRNSGDIQGGDHSRVVGYASIAFEAAPTAATLLAPQSDDEQTLGPILLSHARHTIAHKLGLASHAPPTDDAHPALSRPGTSFVSPQVEVSLLEPAEPMVVQDEAQALAALRPGVDGLILAWRDRQATFLPQVWAQCPQPAQFLAALKHKAGLPADFWADDLRLSRYQVRCFNELAHGLGAAP